MKQRQQSTSTYPIPIIMISSSNHVSGVTGLSPSAWLSKNSASFVAASGAITESGSGWYWLAGASNDRDTLGDLIIHVAASAGADPFDVTYTIVPWNPFDAVRLGLTALPNAAAFAADGLPSASGNWTYTDRIITGGSISDITTVAGSALADSFLTRDWTEITASVPDRSTLNALRFLRNKWSVSGTTMTVTKEDDLAKAWEASLTSSSSASPVTGMTPA